jgi:hypothetical protein
MRGGAHAPLTDEEVERKFVDNVRYGGWSVEQARRFLDVAPTLFDTPRLDALVELRS